MTAENGLVALAGRAKHIDAGLPAIRAGDLVAFVFERVSQRLENHRVVIDEQQPQLADGRDPLATSERPRLQRHPETRCRMRGAPADGTIYLQLGAVTLRDAVDHRETEPRATHALGREERLQAVASSVLVHSHAVVADFDED